MTLLILRLVEGCILWIRQLRKLELLRKLWMIIIIILGLPYNLISTWKDTVSPKLVF
jgi:hypothetical protein